MSSKYMLEMCNYKLENEQAHVYFKVFWKYIIINLHIFVHSVTWNKYLLDFTFLLDYTMKNR